MAVWVAAEGRVGGGKQLNTVVRHRSGDERRTSRVMWFADETASTSVVLSKAQMEVARSMRKRASKLAVKLHSTFVSLGAEWDEEEGDDITR